MKRNKREFLEIYRGPASKMRQIKLRLSHIMESDLSVISSDETLLLETQLLLSEVTSVISSDESFLLVTGEKGAREAEVL